MRLAGAAFGKALQAATETQAAGEQVEGRQHSYQHGWVSAPSLLIRCLTSAKKGSCCLATSLVSCGSLSFNTEVVSLLLGPELDGLSPVLFAVACTHLGYCSLCITLMSLTCMGGVQDSV